MNHATAATGVDVGTLHTASPSMTANTPEDAELKIGLVDDVMTCINVEGM